MGIFGTKYDCFLCFFRGFVLRLVLKTMCSDKVLAWFGVVWP